MRIGEDRGCPPCPLEVRGSAATWIDGRLHQWVSTQHAQGIKGVLVKSNGVEADKVRVRTPDVGGGFGAKIGTYPEEIVLGALSSRLGRPVRWTETRSESMMALGHGRAQVQHVTIGGTRKQSFFSYQRSIDAYPKRVRRGRVVRVYGQLRPAANGSLIRASLQYRRSGSRRWRTVKRVSSTSLRNIVRPRVRVRSSVTTTRPSR